VKPGTAESSPNSAAGASAVGGPLVSFIIPTHNYGHYLLEAIESALAQTYDNFELIVVDDGSTDGTRQLIEPLRDRLRYVRRNQGGPSAARNTGIMASRGQLIAFLDADDVWLPHKTALQVSYLVEHPEVGLVCGRTQAMEDNDRRRPGATGDQPPRRAGERVMQFAAGAAFTELFLHHRNYVATSTVMLRRKCLDLVGMFDESLRRVEDFNLWLRVGRCFALARLPHALARHRRHGSNLARDRDAMRRAVMANLDHICALYPEVAAWRRRVASRLFLKHGLQDLYERRPGEARSNVKAAIRHHPLNAAAYPLLLASYCPACWREAARTVSRLGRRVVRSCGGRARVLIGGGTLKSRSRSALSGAHGREPTPRL